MSTEQLVWAAAISAGVVVYLAAWVLDLRAIAAQYRRIIEEQDQELCEAEAANLSLTAQVQNWQNESMWRDEQEAARREMLEALS